MPLPCRMQTFIGGSGAFHLRRPLSVSAYVLKIRGEIRDSGSLLDSPANADSGESWNRKSISVGFTKT